MVAIARQPFALERLGVIMRPEMGNACESWGTLNPGGVSGPDGHYYLFPRLVAEGNYSRIGRGRVTYTHVGVPSGVERLGVALEPHEWYERSRSGGGLEDPRVTFVEPLSLYVMSYTAYEPPYHPRIALAISRDLVTWQRLGPLHFSQESNDYDLNKCGNKDGILFPEVVNDPHGEPSFAIIHRPTYAIHHTHGAHVTHPPTGSQEEYIWISYAPVNAVQGDIRALVNVAQHHILLRPEAPWEALKVGGGAPPLRLPYGWLFLYHGVQGTQTTTSKNVTYSAGAAVLDLQQPQKLLYRSREPILSPEVSDETNGLVPHVVFPTAIEKTSNEACNVYYGAADSVIAAARMSIPATRPAQ